MGLGSFFKRSKDKQEEIVESHIDINTDDCCFSNHLYGVYFIHQHECVSLDELYLHWLEKLYGRITGPE